MVVSPDVGGLKMAYAYSQALWAPAWPSWPSAARAPRRSRRSTSIGEVDGRNVLIVDDLTETAGTLTSAAKLLKERGAKKIIAAVTHCLLTDDGIERMKASAVEELITTDSVPKKDFRGYPVTVLSVADLLGEAILRVHNDQSVTSLFRM